MKNINSLSLKMIEALAKLVNNAVREEFARLSHVYANIKGLSVHLELMES